MDFTKNYCIIESNGYELRCHRNGNLYEINPNINKILFTTEIIPNNNQIDGNEEQLNDLKQNTSDLDLWHQRLGHANIKVVQDMVKHKLINLTDDKNDNIDCEGCIYGKQHKEKFKKTYNQIKTKEILELIHSDVVGPMEDSTFLGCKYFVIFIDDYSHMIFGFLMKQKSEVTCKFRQFKALVENQTGRHIKTFRSDNGT